MSNLFLQVEFGKFNDCHNPAGDSSGGEFCGNDDIEAGANNGEITYSKFPIPVSNFTAKGFYGRGKYITIPDFFLHDDAAESIGSNNTLQSLLDKGYVRMTLGRVHVGQGHLELQFSSAGAKNALNVLRDYKDHPKIDRVFVDFDKHKFDAISASAASTKLKGLIQKPTHKFLQEGFLTKFNPNHEPAGSSAGGQFASGEGGGSSASSEGDKYRANAIQELGREQINAILNNDPKFSELVKNNEAYDKKITTLQRSNERLLATVDRYGAMTDEQRNDPVNKQRFDEASAKLDANVIKQGSLEFDRYEINKEISERVGAWVTQGQPVSVGIGINNNIAVNNPSQMEFAGSVDRNIRAFEKLVGGSPLNGTNNQVTINLLESGKRSYFNPAENAIYLTPGADRGTVFHEMGHWLEHNTPGGVQAANSFVAVRTAGETARALNGQKDFAGRVMSHFASDEVAKPDKFRDAYVGKIYPNGGASEVTSMGMQYLAESASQFYKMDRGHFEFTVGAIRAARQGGHHWI